MKAVIVAFAVPLLTLGLLIDDLQAVTKRGGGATCRPGQYADSTETIVTEDGVSPQYEQLFAAFYCEARGIPSTIDVASFELHVYDDNPVYSINAHLMVRTETGATMYSGYVTSDCAGGGTCGYQTLTSNISNGSFSNVISFGLRVILHGAAHGLPGDPHRLVGWSIELQ